MAPSIALEDRATVVFVWVADGYPVQGIRWRRGQVGAKPVFSDSKVITRLRLRDFLPFPGETQLGAFLRAHYRPLFPHLLSQSQCNRRAQGLIPLGEALRPYGAHPLGAMQAARY